MEKNKDRVYPISEVFTSPQGEGVYAGTMMTFVRLAGCTVGKPFPKEMYKDRDLPLDTPGSTPSQGLPIYTEKCTLYDGREFACDTDYRVKERLTARQILDRVPKEVDYVCITGGEPLMHDLTDLLTTLRFVGNKRIHIETSGTIDFLREDLWLWITVSPKKNVTKFMLHRANEVKLLVDEHFDPTSPFVDMEMSPLLLAGFKPVYLHPVNYEHEVHGSNLQRCVDWQIMYKRFRVGIQLHKAIYHYTKEFVR